MSFGNVNDFVSSFAQTTCPCDTGFKLSLGTAEPFSRWRSGLMASSKDLFHLTTPPPSGSLCIVSAAEIIQQLPKLTDSERRAIRQVLLEIANQCEDVACCNQSALEAAEMFDRMEVEDAGRRSR